MVGSCLEDAGGPSASPHVSDRAVLACRPLPREGLVSWCAVSSVYEAGARTLVHTESSRQPREWGPRPREGEPLARGHRAGKTWTGPQKPTLALVRPPQTSLPWTRPGFCF